MTQKKANDYQVGGDHYKSGIQHWDYVVANDLDYFQAQITRYVTRWKKKAGMADLEKARHFLEKYIEIEKTRAGIAKPIDFPARVLPKRTGDTGQKYPFGYDADSEI